MSKARAGLFCLCVVFTLAGLETAHADVVSLAGGMAIEGEVTEVGGKWVRMLVPAGENVGELMLPRERVLRIEYDIESRREALAPDDWAAHYRLALWALKKGLKNDALDLLLTSAGKPGVPPEAYLHAARLLEEVGELEKAVELYNKFLLLQPDRKDIAQKVRELVAQTRRKEKETPGKSKEAETPKGTAEAAKSGPKAQETTLGTTPPKKETAAAPQEKEAAAQPQQPAAPEPQPEGIEAHKGWKRESWGGNAKIETMTQPDGNVLLMIDIPKGGAEKVAVSLGTRMDTTKYSRAVFSVFNGEQQKIQIAMAFITSTDFYESRPVIVKPDWNGRLSIDLTAEDFKCRANKWTFRSPIEGRKDVSKVLFMVYNYGRKCLVYLDNVGFE